VTLALAVDVALLGSETWTATVCDAGPSPMPNVAACAALSTGLEPVASSYWPSPSRSHL
jgi:hypothetical protein